jgi:hypothetical protein
MVPVDEVGTRAGRERAEREALPRPRVRERLEMVKAAALGRDLAAIARWVGRSRPSVRLRRRRGERVAAAPDR